MAQSQSRLGIPTAPADDGASGAINDTLPASGIIRTPKANTRFSNTHYSRPPMVQRAKEKKVALRMQLYSPSPSPSQSVNDSQVKSDSLIAPVIHYNADAVDKRPSRASTYPTTSRIPLDFVHHVTSAREIPATSLNSKAASSIPETRPIAASTVNVTSGLPSSIVQLGTKASDAIIFPSMTAEAAQLESDFITKTGVPHAVAPRNSSSMAIDPPVPVLDSRSDSAASRKPDGVDFGLVSMPVDHTAASARVGRLVDDDVEGGGFGGFGDHVEQVVPETPTSSDIDIPLFKLPTIDHSKQATPCEDNPVTVRPPVVVSAAQAAEHTNKKKKSSDTQRMRSPPSFKLSSASKANKALKAVYVARENEKRRGSVEVAVSDGDSEKSLPLADMARQGKSNKGKAKELAPLSARLASISGIAPSSSSKGKTKATDPPSVPSASTSAAASSSSSTSASSSSKGKARAADPLSTPVASTSAAAPLPIHLSLDSMPSFQQLQLGLYAGFSGMLGRRQDRAAQLSRLFGRNSFRPLTAKVPRFKPTTYTDEAPSARHWFELIGIKNHLWPDLPDHNSDDYLLPPIITGFVDERYLRSFGRIGNVALEYEALAEGVHSIIFTFEGIFACLEFIEGSHLALEEYWHILNPENNSILAASALGLFVWGLVNRSSEEILVKLYHLRQFLCRQAMNTVFSNPDGEVYDMQWNEFLFQYARTLHGNDVRVGVESEEVRDRPGSRPSRAGTHH